MNQPKPQFIQVTTPQGSIVFVNIHAIRRAEYFPANDNGGSMLFLDTPGGQATSLADEADALWALLQPLAVPVPARESDARDFLGITEADFNGMGETVVHLHPNLVTINGRGGRLAAKSEEW